MPSPLHIEANIDDIFNLNTASWFPTDMSDVFNGAQQRGSDLSIAFKRGQVARKRIIDSREINIPMYIYGDKYPDGTPTGNSIKGLIQMIDLFKAFIASPGNNTDGTRTLNISGPDFESRTGKVIINPDLHIKHVGVGVVQILLNMILVDGVFEGTNNNTVYFTSVPDWDISGPSATETLWVQGSGDVYAAEILVDGDLTSLEIQNLNYAGAPGVSLRLNTTVNASPTNDTGNSLNIYGRDFTAIANGNPVQQHVTSNNTLYWLPLQQGPNNIVIKKLSAGGSTCNITIKYKAVYL